MHMMLPLFLCASTASVRFKFGFDIFEHFVCLGVFIFFCFSFKVNSGVFLHSRVAKLSSTENNCCKPKW